MAAPVAVIFDIDGTLVDSNDAHAQAWVDALAEQGRHVEFAEVRRLIGMGGDKLLPALTEIEHESNLGKEISARRKAIFQEQHLPKLRAHPDARALVERLRADGVDLVIATSATGEEVEGLLKAAGVADLIPQRTSSDDAEASKPDPDIILAALEQLNCPPGATIMIGDTPYDIAAASKAGVPTIALRCGGWGDDDLQGAVAIYDHPADLLAHYAQSPLAR